MRKNSTLKKKYQKKQAIAIPRYEAIVAQLRPSGSSRLAGRHLDIDLDEWTPQHYTAATAASAILRCHLKITSTHTNKAFVIAAIIVGK